MQAYNYEGFSAIKDIEGGDKTALNIIIKEKYLGKIIGNADVFVAYNTRYKTHTNLFRFAEKANITSIVDLNNTGEQALSLKEYMNMNKSIKQDMRNNDVSLSPFTSLPAIPDFLLNTDVKSKNTEPNLFLLISLMPLAKKYLLMGLVFQTLANPGSQYIQRKLFLLLMPISLPLITYARQTTSSLTSPNLTLIINQIKMLC